MGMLNVSLPIAATMSVVTLLVITSKWEAIIDPLRRGVRE